LMLFLFPVTQVFLHFWFIIVFFFQHLLPLNIVMFSFIPLALLIFQISIQITGLIEILIIRKQIKFIPLGIIGFIITYIPYQLLLSFCAVRALFRILFGMSNWEKTTHLNLHRKYVDLSITG
jgi:glycosyltransferase XagB